MNDARRLRLLATDAAALVENGMNIGLGSGSTAEAFVHALGTRVREGLEVAGVPTSHRTETLARSLNIPLTTLTETPSLDLGIDGADEISPDLDLVKGRGGALLYEKVVAMSCDRFVIVAASEKLVESLGLRIGLPVEVIPFGWERTADRIALLGIEPRLRQNEDQTPFITDGGHYVLDCVTGVIDHPSDLATSLKQTVGVVDHGLFVGIAHSAMVIDNEDTVSTIARTSG